MDRIQHFKENPAEALRKELSLISYERLRLVNMAVGAFMIVGGVGHILQITFSNIILGVYLILAGLVTLGLEARTPTEQHKTLVQRYASFMHSFGGRGAFYLLVGVLILNFNVIFYISGTIVGFTGLVYLGLHFFPLFEAPSTMQPPNSTDEESQPVWQAPSE